MTNLNRTWRITNRFLTIRNLPWLKRNSKVARNRSVNLRLNLLKSLSALQIRVAFSSCFPIRKQRSIHVDAAWTSNVESTWTVKLTNKRQVSGFTEWNPRTLSTLYPRYIYPRCIHVASIYCIYVYLINPHRIHLPYQRPFPTTSNPPSISTLHLPTYIHLQSS